MRNYFIIGMIMFSLSGNAQFNNAHKIELKEIGFQLCIKNHDQRTEVGVEIEITLITSKDENIELQQVWSFPRKIKDEEGNHFRQVKTMSEKPTNESFLLSYSIVENSDLIKGNWKFELYHRGKLIYEKDFLVR